MKEGQKEYTKVKTIEEWRERKNTRKRKNSGMKEGEKEYTKVKKLRNERGKERIYESEKEE